MFRYKKNPGLDYLRSTVVPQRSPLSVCFSSRMRSGAWQIRGEQIAAMRSNWQAISTPTIDQIDRFDLFCFVKKPDLRLIEQVRRAGKPIVFDIVDCWAQPADGYRYTDVASARGLFKRMWAEIGADGYIFPNDTMHKDMASLVNKSVTIYHHYYPLLQENPVRTQVTKIGFIGKGLGEWKRSIKQACKQRGIEFVINPSKHTDLDIVVIVRGGRYGSFLARRYKSNVKLANAYGSGTPALVHSEEMSAHDTDNGAVLFFTSDPGSFEQQLDRLISDYTLRKLISERFLATAKDYAIANIADRFEAFFVQIIDSYQQQNDRTTIG